MTIEIRELVIQAKVTVPEETPSVMPVRNTAQQKADEAKLIELVMRRVLEKLREQGSWIR